MEISSIKHLWLDAGYQGMGKSWAEGVLGLSVKVVRKPLKPVSEKLSGKCGAQGNEGLRS